ncbi:replicative DNA helicase [Parvularcula sp. ZS-1/3]|uniref:Replicative DNA helicase n=1 Tax=Parvularcula mediterranea TaxID=2732508 RepID=A0A7Y3W491_9PROT|nr:replicative DNA helicase [Parvularcula mediterranea]NNU15233.1 replicative DNA helicase [Parvularcula mediterranea]
MPDGSALPATLGGPDEKKLPYSIDAEQALLGAVLYDNEVFYKVNGYLKPEHFYDPLHGKIYEACDKLISSGRLASPVMLNTYFGDETAFHEAGGERYLVSLAQAVPTTVGAADYGRLIFDLHTSRGLINIGSQMIERANTADIDDNPRGQVEAAEKELYALAETGHYGGGFESFESALTTAINIAQAAFQRGGGLSGVTSGLRDLDGKLGGLHGSDLIILAGRPSMGKTALATNIAVNAAKAFVPEKAADGSYKNKEGARVGFFSLEMSSDQLASRILAEFSGVASDKIRRGDINEQDFVEIYDAAGKLEQLPLYIDDTGGLTIAQVAARARRLKRMNGLDMLVIDYLQLLAGSKKAGENRVQELTEITTGLKALAKELSVPIIALSQLSRQVENREDKRPQLSDLRESGSIEQDADVVMFVYREEYYLGRTEPREGTPEHIEWQQKMDDVHGMAEVIIGKQRHGPIGTVKLSFAPELTRFGDYADPDRYPQQY